MKSVGKLVFSDSHNLITLTCMHIFLAPSLPKDRRLTAMRPPIENQVLVEYTEPETDYSYVQVICTLHCCKRNRIKQVVVFTNLTTFLQ